MPKLNLAQSIRCFTTPMVLVLLLLGVTDQSAADFSFDHAGHSYLVVTTPATWLGAAVDAASHDLGGVFGELARIDNQAENDAIAAALAANIPAGDHHLTRAPDGGGGAYVWIGATDRQAEGQWIWDGDGNGSGDQFWQGDKNGSAVGGRFNLWGTTGGQNEPDDFFSSQDAGGISLDGWPLGLVEQWNDVDETNSLYYLVEFATAASNLGDYNNDGTVNAADYTVWLDNLGSPAGIPNDNNLGTVGQLHYDLWKARFDATAATATIPAVPEPSSLLLLVSLLSISLVRHQRS